ncbi:MAG: LTA synthase family protein [Oscillospiraceae bacterium]|nr:LTA synthase family protein [Oscillospiraceae bacterium]
MKNSSAKTISAPIGPVAFLRARYARDLTSRTQRALFHIWSLAALLAASVVLCVLSLFLGLGMMDIELFFDYFRHPLIFYLNWIPVLLLLLFCYGLTGRQWLSYLLGWLFVVLPSIGSFYKQRFRSEPLMFSDIGSIRAGLSVAGKYDLTPNVRVLIALAALPLGLLLLALLVRGRPAKPLRVTACVCALAAAAGLWFTVYSDHEFYEQKAVSDEHIFAKAWTEITFVSKGSVYPFLHSIVTSAGYPPDGYDKKEAAEILSAYTDAAIPDDRRVDLLVFQLESFCDMSLLGLEGLDEHTYDLYHALEEESYTGTLVTNVMGGGTINTERCFLTGSSELFEYHRDVESYVRYLRRQGYTALASHPHFGTFYSRIGVNGHLGFEEFWYRENHYEADVSTLENEWMSDRFVFPDVLAQYREHAARGENVFSFTVTTQGHGPHPADAYDGYLYWQAEGCSDKVRNQVNDYLRGVVDTQERLAAALDELRGLDEPVVLLAYGDHKPHFTEGGDFFGEAGIDVDLSTLTGCLNYYSTRYLIWANDAAKALLGDDFIGEGPTVSPCFLLSVVFDKLGWEGSAFMQLTREVRDEVPVINTTGFYLVDGRLVTALDAAQQELCRRMTWAQYALNQTVYRG